MDAARIYRALIALLLPLLLAGCSSAWLLDWASYPEDRALARAAIDDLIAGNRVAFAARLPEAVRPQLATQFAPMRRALPRGGIAEIGLVDAGWTSVAAIGVGDYRDSRLAYEIVGGNRRALAQMVIRRQGGTALITSFNVSLIDRPAREVNAFRPGDGGLANYAVLIIAIAGLAITVTAIRRVWTSGLFRRRWLWIIGCLIGLFRFTTIWGTAQTGFDPLGITLFSSGAVRQGLAPWTIFAGIPVVAIWVLLRHRALIARGRDG